MSGGTDKGDTDFSSDDSNVGVQFLRILANGLISQVENTEKADNDRFYNYLL